jgi:hypothetical protein
MMWCGDTRGQQSIGARAVKRRREIRPLTPARRIENVNQRWAAGFLGVGGA